MQVAIYSQSHSYYVSAPNIIARLMVERDVGIEVSCSLSSHLQ